MMYDGVSQDLAAQYWNSVRHRRTVLRMTLDEARKEVISGIDYAAHKETDSSLHDADKNRLFGSEHYKSGSPFTNLVRGQREILKIRWEFFCGWPMH
jgi:hypothetical protein